MSKQTTASTTPTTDAGDKTPRHLRITEPSPWVARFAPLIKAGGRVLDLACGGGRHTRLLLGQGYHVTAVDRDTSPVDDLRDHENIEIITTDLEDEHQPPLHALAGCTFDGIIVSNYLHRPLFGAIADALAPGGVLIYETFARGNEAFCKPRNPDHLLKNGELIDWLGGRMQIIAYEHGRTDRGPIAGVIQHICAINDLQNTTRDDGEPDPHAI